MTSSGGLKRRSHAVGLKAIEKDLSGRPLEDTGREKTEMQPPIRILRLRFVSITIRLLLLVKLCRTPNHCIDFTWLNSVLLREGRFFFINAAQHERDQLSSTMPISVGAPDIEAAFNVSTCARTELALALNAKETMFLQALDTKVRLPISEPQRS